ncbi:MAG: PQQ-binding-like beta-propeller repeat protein [bacterium]|nr:PQQ-binding-like beta-propeller repeat protein [bacterium]
MKTNLLVLLIAAGMATALYGASTWPHWKRDSANTAAALHGTRAVPTPLWQYPVPGINDGQQGVVLDASNNVIFLTTSTGEIISMSPAGTNWITKIGGSGNWGGVCYGNNNTVYGTPYSSTSGVYAINAANGAIKWSYINAGDSDNVPSVGPDGTIYALNGAAQLVALTDLGGSYTVKWTRAIGGGGYEGAGAVPVWQDPVGSGIYLWVNTEGSAAGVNNMTILRDDGTHATVLATLPVGKSWSKGAVRDGVCYLSTFTDYGTSNLYCLNTTGLVWQTVTGVNMFNSPALGANGRIYLAGQGGIVAAFDYLGVRQWITNYGTDEIVAAPTVLNNGIVYVMSKTAGIVYCIKDTGSAAQLLWTYSAGSGLGGAPAIGNDGTLYLAANLRTIALAPYVPPQFAAYDAMNYPVGSLGGQTGGYGWGSAWDGSKPVVANGLTYEQGGQRLVTAGNKISVASGSDTNRRLLTNDFAHLLTPAGGFCADGKTLWLSLLLQDGSATVDAYGGLWLNNLAGTAQTGWDITRNWGAYRWYIETPDTGTSVLHTAFYTTNQPQATLFVAKMEFLPGNELCSFWFNPPLSNAPPAPDYVLSVSNFSFSGVHLSGSDLIYDDEVRVGETWQSIVPITAPPIGWCSLQWPYTLTVVNTNGPGISDKVYGQIWIDQVTSQPGPTPGLKAWLGYGPTNALPNAPSWQWTPADFNVQVGNNDEFYTNLVIAQAVPAGDYAYCYYYEYQTNAMPSTGYGQKDGGPRTLATYNPAQSGLLTVVPEPALLLGLMVGLTFVLRKQ